VSQFDGARALREEIQGLGDIKVTIRRRIQVAETRLMEAQSDLDDAVKLRGFCDAEIDRKRAVLKQLEETT
jgi:hypothetical protein